MFYSNQGNVVETVPLSKGEGQRKATIRDARSMGLVPRFSSVINYKSSYALENWKLETAIEVALQNPTLGKEGVLELLSGDRDVSMNRGTEIHRSIEHYLKNGRSMLYQELCESIQEGVMSQFDSVISEAKIITPWFGGTADLIGLKHGTFSVLDFKTTGNIDKVKAPYDKWILQLSAYAWGIKTSGMVKGLNAVNSIVVIDQNTLQWKRLNVSEQDIKDATQEWVAILYAWHKANKLSDPSPLKDYL